MKELDSVDLSVPPTVELKEELEEEKKEEKEKTLGDYLSEFAGAPDGNQIEQWKQVHGEILCSGLSDKELYIFRPIAREEFVNLQTVISQSKEQVSNFEIEKKIVETCVLWASQFGIDALAKKAGTYTTLHEQILQSSNFVNPAYVSQFVIKL